MKKPIFIIFLFTSLIAYSDIATTKDEKNIINQEISGVNKQQLDVRDITTEELILRNQNLEITSIDISGKNFKEKDDKIEIKKNNDNNLKEELSKGIKKSFFSIFD